jgi:spermidine synthase
MKTAPSGSRVPKTITALVLAAAALAGFCTMAYEVAWFRVLKYFVDNSIHSFAIMLTTFLFGITVGGILVPRFADRRKDMFLFLGITETFVGLSSVLSIPLIAGMNRFIDPLNKVFGTGWGGEISIRFIVFSLALLLPTALMGAAFPLIVEIYSKRPDGFGKTVGEAYSVNTLGGVLGSFCGGFALVPAIGVQNTITLLAALNVVVGLACFAVGSASRKGTKTALAASTVFVFTACVLAVPRNAFLGVYNAKYPPPANRMLYCRENVNGTTVVFQDTRRAEQKYFLIDGTGEVSTDYFSMRAFRFLGVLPAIYSPEPKNALIVTFGSGIVAGEIANLPGMEHVDCVEICRQAFDASRYFAEENHDVVKNPRVRLIVNDGRNYVFTSRKTYDVISADATHPTSSDSWILYTKEFYGLCRDRLSERGVMCQWIPLHGILERDYKVILATFHTAFPYVAVYYSGGYKTMGHTVLIGSKSPLRIDYGKARALFSDSLVKNDLNRVNVFDLYDLLGGFVLDQEAVDEFKTTVPLNTDDRPCIIFSKFRLDDRPFMGLSPLMAYRKNVFSQLYGMDADSVASIKTAVDGDFEAMGYAMGGQILEFKEYNLRRTQDFNQPRDAIVQNLMESRALFEQAISNYRTALTLYPGDRNTQYLLDRASDELAYLNSFLDAASAPR